MFHASLFTFHYVSILINAPKYVCNSSYFIYIPLCLYFNFINLSIIVTTYIIYIPLCLYFNLGWCETNHRSKRIYIPLCLYFNTYPGICHVRTPEFTFHYVSILMQEVTNGFCQTNFIYIPLCLYFNSATQAKKARLLSIYIPLCLYFNPAPNKVASENT